MHVLNRAFQLLVLLLFASGALFGQPYKDSIRSQFQVYTDLIIKKDFQGSLRFVNPEFLKIVPGAQLVAAMEQTMNNPQVEVKMGEMKILSISDTQIVNGRYYVQVRYLSEMAMRMREETDTTSMKQGLAARFGKDNVQYDQATEFYHLTMRKNVVADSNDAKRWTFVVAEERQLPLLQKFIPRELLNF